MEYMDNDLLDKWLVADMMNETEVRDLLTELQTARDDLRAKEDADETALSELREEVSKLAFDLIAIHDKLVNL